ncbi:STAS domain-containing protein [Cellulomonas soli]
MSVLAERVVAAVAGAGGLGPVLRRRLDHFFVTGFDAGTPSPTSRPEGVRITPVGLGDLAGLSVAGALDLATASELAAALSELVTHAPHGSTVAVDLREVSYLSPAAAATLRSAGRRAAARGVHLRVVPGRAEAGWPQDRAEDVVEFVDAQTRRPASSVRARPARRDAGRDRPANLS